jgi:hypothetical protein
MSKCIGDNCPNEALATAAVCEWHLHNPSNTVPPKEAQNG